MRSHITFQMGVGVLLVAGATSLAIAADTSGDNKDMVLIPKGEFTMGSNEHSDEVRHQVVLDAYLLDKFETSNARYKEFMRATGHPAPAYWDDPRLSKPEQPVVGVSWTDANAFCKWDGKRLPTEAEWEKAAKGPEGDNHYPWGHHLDPKKANYGQNVGRTMPVDSYPDGVSGYGIYNMAGNVFEWVDDWYDPKYYKTSNALNPKGADKGYNFANQGPVKVLRGGSWLAPETSLHTSHRFWNQPENNSYGVGLGFRCAKSVSAVSEEAAQAGRDAFIQALVGMGAEKNADAMASIEKALAADPNNKEVTRLVSFFPTVEQPQVRTRLAENLRAVVSLRLLPNKKGDGRVPAVEIMRSTRSIQECIKDASRTAEITDYIARGRTEQMQTFDQHVLDLLRANKISIETALAAATNPDDFRTRLALDGPASEAADRDEKSLDPFEIDSDERF